MTITPRLVRKAENREFPLQALAALTEIKETLDELEAGHIEAARKRGASWTDIAEAMKISRQALQQRMSTRKAKEPA
jgi:transcriptional regulator with PAS, ATPase and Fis domain